MHINREQMLYVLYIKEMNDCDLDNAKRKYNLLDDSIEINTTEENILKDIVDKQAEIDQIIADNLENYHLNRLNKIDLQIIRIASYELKYTKLAKAIIINEAVNLSKKYSDTESFRSSRFNNKLLDTIAKNVRD